MKHHQKHAAISASLNSIRFFFPCYFILQTFPANSVNRTTLGREKYLCPFISKPLHLFPLPQTHPLLPPTPPSTPGPGEPLTRASHRRICLLHKQIDHFHPPPNSPRQPPPCHLFCPELKIHFHNPSLPPPATTSPDPSTLHVNLPPIFSQRGFMARSEVEGTCLSQKSDSSR